jgi:hypothetical protein
MLLAIPITGFAQVPPQSSITILEPSPYQTWYIGDYMSIVWNTGNIGGLVKIELSRDNGSTWETIIPSTPNNGAFQTLKVSGPATATALVRITSLSYPSVSDTSDIFILLEFPRSITVTSPNGGETWSVGESRNMTWNALNAGTYVKIDISRDGGGTWTPINSMTENDGIYSWGVTSPVTNTARMRVTSVHYSNASDLSDDDFTIRSDPYLLIVTKTGAGSGTIISIPAGIDCGMDCSQSYSYNQGVTLSKIADEGSIFMYWSGDPDCSDGFVSMNASKTCTAVFGLIMHNLTVSRTGSGTGTVTSSPAGIICGNDCEQGYTAGTSVTLTPVADGGSAFAGWSGAPDCTDGVVLMNTAKMCTARFDAGLYSLTVIKTGTGSGTVTSSPTGIICGTACSHTYSGGRTVTLTPSPDTGSVFSGWSGDADCVDGAVLIDASKTCTAVFDIEGSPPPTPTGVTASDGLYTDRIYVSWNYVANATTYNVYRAVSAPTLYFTYLAYDVPSPFYNDFTATPGVKYYYKVRAINSYGMSWFSSDDGGYIFLDSDGDGIQDGDGTNPCTGGNTTNCDDNCAGTPNTNQADVDSNGIGDACEAVPNWKGDINEDGVVDISDVIRVLRIALDLDAFAFCADINSDDIVDISDVILTLRMALGLDPLQQCI